MTKQSTFDRLPQSWQLRVKEMREECKVYRLRLRAANERIAELEAGIALAQQKAIADLRRENGKYRTERNALRAELEALRSNG